MNEHLELSITEAGIECEHQIEKPRDASKKSRPVIAKFVRHNDRKKVYSRKKN